MQLSHRKALGRAGEEHAVALLKSAGYEVVQRNWRDGRRGELDIIAETPETTVVVEVRTRIGDLHGTPLESVDERKMRRLRGLAAAWAREHACKTHLRIDVMALTVPSTSRQEAVRQCEAGTVDLDSLGVHLQWIEALQ
ncbi:YraN family protein [Schaalia sp. 19OD2882]|uniref:YraN family protein n=1 Tax=Schaalia sp. 19OD2882 TaxID=2794089 RepID=UPI001C1E9964|nr:YraN family protein [Schaalia sp. 19OD2882]QWW18819.1 YraN family protein [Schaalia sp. 19OD2882]